MTLKTTNNGNLFPGVFDFANLHLIQESKDQIIKYLFRI